MKIHSKHLGHVAIGRRFKHICCGRTVKTTSWAQFDATLKRRVTRVFLRVLSSGGEVVELPGAEWEIRWRPCCGKFAKQYDTAERIAEHVASRVCGFGWPVAIVRGAT